MKAARDAFALAWSALRAAPGRTVALVGGIAVAGFLPAFVVRAGWMAEAALLERARATPIVIGRKGDVHDLVMSSVYFRGQVREPLSEADVHALRAPGLTLVPLHTGHSAGGIPVVGTTLAYLERRGLAVQDGRRPAVLGEVVAGAGVAFAHGLRPGDHVRSDVRDPYDLAGAFPLLLEVVGVLAPSGGPDDEVLIADLKTAWVMDGLLHGHGAAAGADVLSNADDVVIAAPSLVLHTEIDAGRLGTFHLHGGPEDRPVSSVLAFPDDARAHDVLLGHLAVDARRQAVRPEGVVRGLLAIVLRLQRWAGGAVALVALSTAAFVFTVLTLSLRLRQAELSLLRRLGASPARVAGVVGAEIAVVVVVAGVWAWVGTEVGLALLAGRLGGT